MQVEPNFSSALRRGNCFLWYAQHHNSSKAGGALDKYLFTFLLKKKKQHRWFISLIIQFQFDFNKSNKIVCNTFDLLILKCGTNPTEWKCSENEHSILNIVEKELVNDGKENLEIHLLSHKEWAAESVSTISLSASAVSY